MRTQQETEEALWSTVLHRSPRRPHRRKSFTNVSTKRQTSTHSRASDHLRAVLRAGNTRAPGPTAEVNLLQASQPCPESQRQSQAIRENKTNGKAASQPGTPRTEGRHAPHRLTPHRWPVFHGCWPEGWGGSQESESPPRPNQIPGGQRSPPFPSRTQVATGNAGETQGVRPPPTPQISPVHAVLMGMARLTVTSPPIPKEKPQSHEGGQGHIQGGDRSPDQAVTCGGDF